MVAEHPYPLHYLDPRKVAHIGGTVMEMLGLPFDSPGHAIRCGCGAVFVLGRTTDERCYTGDVRIMV